MAICCVSKKIQTAYLRNTLRALDFFASLHLTIFERPANFDFFNSQFSKGEQKYTALPNLANPLPRPVQMDAGLRPGSIQSAWQSIKEHPFIKTTCQHCR